MPVGSCVNCHASDVEVHPLQVPDGRRFLLCPACTARYANHWDRLRPSKPASRLKQPLNRKQIVSAFIGAVLVIAALTARDLHPSPLTRPLVWIVLASGVVVPLVERSVKRRR